MIRLPSDPLHVVMPICQKWQDMLVDLSKQRENYGVSTKAYAIAMSDMITEFTQFLSAQLELRVNQSTNERD